MKDMSSSSSNKETSTTLVPPIQPFSPQEIYKFTALDLALRSHPELAREGASLLNPRALAKLVHGIKSFQDNHLGRRSKYTASKSWPITKLPDPIFRSRSANGPLYSLLLTSYKVKKQQSWKAFDFVSMNRYDDNLLLMTEIEKALIKDGWLVRPVCYFDTTVDKERVEEYTKIIERYGGVVVDEFNGVLEGGVSLSSIKGGSSSSGSDGSKSGKDNVGASGDTEEVKEDSSSNNSGHPKRKKRKKNTKTPKKKAEAQQSKPKEKEEPKQQHVVTHVIAWDGEEHDAESTLQQEQESAYAHNYDIVEKLYLRTISIVDPRKQNRGNNNIVETNMLETKKKGGRLGGKGKKGKSPNDPTDPMLDNNTPMAFVHWWYLPSSYDEFMLASDVDGDNDIPPKPDGGPWVVGCKFVRDVERYNEWGLEEDYAITDYEKKVSLYKDLAKKKEEEAKRLKEEEEQAKKNKSQSRKKSKSPTLRLRLSNPNKSSVDQQKQKEVKIGMNPRQIFTGYYDNRTKIKRVVYDGALFIPKEASSLIKQSLVTTGIPIPETPMSFELPKVGTVLRPSEDPELLCKNSNNDNGFLITELRHNGSGSTDISNRLCVPKESFQQNEAILVDTGSLPRIRGGGDNETGGDDSGAQVKAEPMDTSEDGKGEVIKTADNNQQSNQQNVQQESKETVITPQDSQADVEMKVENEIVKQEAASDIVENVSQAENKLESAQAMTNVVETKAAAPHELKSAPAMTNVAETKAAAPHELKSAPAMTNVVETKAAAPHELKSAPAMTNVVETKAAAPQSTNIADQVKVENSDNDTVSKLTDGTAKAAKADPPETLPANTDDQQSSDSQPLKRIKLDPPCDESISSEPKPQKSQSEATLDKKHEETEMKVVKEEKKDETQKLDTPKAPEIVPFKNKEKDSKTHEDKKSFVGDQERTCVLPGWYDATRVSSLEQTLLPEWFDNSSDHRTPKTYIETRERMIEVARKSPHKYVTATAIRRCVPGDAGSLMRMHQYLVSWGFINGSAIGESAPTVSIDQNKTQVTSAVQHIDPKWTTDMVNVLTAAVASFATKKRKRDEDESVDVTIDWNGVAQKVARNTTPHDCYHKFLSLTFENMKPNVLNQLDTELETDDATAVTIENETKDGSESLVSQLIDGVRPVVAQAAIDASFKASGGDLSETQKASVLASVANNAADIARKEEESAGRILQEILDQRMSKLENRLSLLDDLECMFDAERMALELERRDLYTLRCRHWFSGDS